MENRSTFKYSEIFISTIIFGIVSAVSHFVYELSGNNLIVGLFNPVNESVWEHLKFMFFPVLLWWIVMYWIKNRKWHIPLRIWIVAAGVSLAAAPVLVVLLFYSYTGALGIESLIIDGILMLISYFLVLCLAAFILKHANPGKWAVVLSVVVIAIIFIMLIVFTVNPPQLPIFYDTGAQKYGI